MTQNRALEFRKHKGLTMKKKIKYINKNFFSVKKKRLKHFSAFLNPLHMVK